MTLSFPAHHLLWNVQYDAPRNRQPTLGVRNVHRAPTITDRTEETTFGCGDSRVGLYEAQVGENSQVGVFAGLQTQQAWQKC